MDVLCRIQELYAQRERDEISGEEFFRQLGETLDRGPVRASPEQVQEAREKYALRSDNNVEIDTNAVTSETDFGVWVSAWLWLSRREEDAEPESACDDCGRPLSGQDRNVCGECCTEKSEDKCDARL